MPMPDDASTAPTPVQRVLRLFEQRYGRSPASVARAPGRVEVIGNHTDYNGGMVIGATIDRFIVAAAAVRDDREIRLASAGNDTTVSANLDALHPRSDATRWTNYPLGVLAMLLREDIRIDRGFDIAFASSVPTGAGLSSSAALELSTAEALLRLFDQTVDPVALVRACRRAENEFVGVPSGILDQGVSKFGAEDHVVSIDCREETFNVLPLPQNTSFWVFNSHQKHALVGSLYEKRHQECQEALAALQERFPEAAFLTDLTPSEVESARDRLSDALYKRALHITSENERVAEAVSAMAASDEHALGRLLFASHASSQHYFENSTAELDFLVSRLRLQEDVLGARLTGGGFGGAALALTTTAFDRDQVNEIQQAYRETFDAEVTVLKCRTADGARPLERHDWDS